MKNFFTILMSTLAGIFFGLWVSERQRRLETAAQGMSSPQSIVREPRKDRTPEEISATYKNRRPRMSDYAEDDVADHLKALALELAQPSLSPLEAERVGNALHEIMLQARTCDEDREQRKERQRNIQADRWIDEIGKGDANDD